eukprot:1157842-Pelagomonas_calceolata.AAC.5
MPYKSRAHNMPAPVTISGTEIEFYEFDEAGKVVVKSRQSLQVSKWMGTPAGCSQTGFAWLLDFKVVTSFLDSRLT